MSISPQDILTNGQVPTGSFLLLSGKVYMDLGALIGQTVGSLGDAVMPEVALKLHMGCWNAQNTYNAVKPQGQRLNVWQAPVSGSSQYYSSGVPAGYYQNWNFQGNVLIPANLNEVVGVFQ